VSLYPNPENFCRILLDLLTDLRAAFFGTLLADLRRADLLLTDLRAAFFGTLLADLRRADLLLTDLRAAFFGTLLADLRRTLLAILYKLVIN
jgi:hypothetical protein